MSANYNPSSYVRVVDVSVRKGNFDWCHPSETFYSIHIDDPDFRDDKGDGFSLLVKEERGDSSWLSEPWNTWLPEAVETYIKHIWLSSALPLARAWLAAWRASAALDDSMDTLYGMCYAKKHIASMQRRIDSLNKGLERLNSYANSEDELRRLEAEHRAICAEIEEVGRG